MKIHENISLVSLITFGNGNNVFLVFIHFFGFFFQIAKFELQIFELLILNVFIVSLFIVSSFNYVLKFFELLRN